VVICGLAGASYFASYMRLPVVPLFARELGGTAREVGLINSVFLLMLGILSFPFGLLSDRLGRTPLVAAGLLVAGLSGVLLALTATVRQVVAVYLLFGLGLAAVGPNLMSAVADLSPLGYLGRAYGWYTTAIYAGMSLGPAVGGWLAAHLGYRPLFLVSAGLTLALAALSWVLLPGREELKKSEPPGNGLPPPPLGVIFRRHGPLWGCWLASLGGCYGLGAFVTFTPLHAQDRGLSLKAIGVVFAVQAAASALSRLPFGRLSDAVRRRWIPAAGGLWAIAAAVALLGLTRTFAQLTAAALALGVAMGLAFTSVGALIAEVAPPGGRGLAMGGYNASLYLGMMLGALGMGLTAGPWGMAVSFGLAGLAVAVSAVGFILLVRPFVPPAR
jgi:MFS family permease